MGSVRLAQHEVMHREVAVKVIRPDLLSRPGAAGRFLREVRAAARLDHPNIVRAYDAEQAGESWLLAMEYVAGATLADLIADGPLPVAEAYRAVRDAARGLAHAHAAGLVHRDVKPHNPIRAANGTVKVLDFGLAGVGTGEVIAAGGEGLTGAGMVVGTPDYIAPEQVADPHAADARADVYGLGCPFYHLFAGRPAFPGGSIREKLAAHETSTPDPIPGLAADLATVLAKMLAKRPADRYRSADEVVAALDDVIRAVAAGRGPTKDKVREFRNAIAVAVGLFIAVVLGVAAVVYKVERDNEEVVTPDGRTLATGAGNTFRVWDLSPGGANAPAPTPLVGPGDGWTPQFNAKDLTGWRQVGGTPATWRVENGVLRAAGSAGALVSDRPLGDFQLKAEVRLSPGASWALGFRSDPQAEGKDGLTAKYVYKGQTNDVAGHVRMETTLTRDGDPLAKYVGNVKPNDWFPVELTVRGDEVNLCVSGGGVSASGLRQPIPRGPVVFRLLDPNAVLELRNLAVRELAPKP